MSELFLIGLALGVFIGNWLIIPFVNRNLIRLSFETERSYKDGFYIGLISASIVLILGVFIF